MKCNDGKREDIFSSSPSSSWFPADREVFDAVMGSDGRTALGGSCSRGEVKWDEWFRDAKLHGNVRSSEWCTPKDHHQLEPGTSLIAKAERKRENDWTMPYEASCLRSYGISLCMVDNYLMMTEEYILEKI